MPAQKNAEILRPISLGPVSYLEGCRRAYEEWCRPLPCEAVPGPEFTACQATFERICQDGAEALAAAVSAGRAFYDPELGGQCFGEQLAHWHNSAVARCMEADSPGYWRLRFIIDHQVECVDGRPVRPRSDACQRMYGGRGQPGEPCAFAAECASGYCSNAGAPQTCGQCQDYGGIPVGDPCGTDGLGVFCADDGVCDDVTHRCMPRVGSGQPCGPGVGVCTESCGLVCSQGDGGIGVCRSKPQLGETCRRDRSCATGLVCRFPTTPPGPTDANFGLQEGVCQPFAQEGEPCSFGANFDENGPNEWSGGAGDERYPPCACGLDCERNAGEYDGICRVRSDAEEGEACSATRRCRDWQHTECVSTDGGMRCVSSDLPEGAACAPHWPEQCEAPLLCIQDSSNQSQCTEMTPHGEACDTYGECGTYSTCHEGVCTYHVDLPQPSAPSCP